MPRLLLLKRLVIAVYGSRCVADNMAGMPGGEQNQCEKHHRRIEGVDQRNKTPSEPWMYSITRKPDQTTIEMLATQKTIRNRSHSTISESALVVGLRRMRL